MELGGDTIRGGCRDASNMELVWSGDNKEYRGGFARGGGATSGGGKRRGLFWEVPASGNGSGFAEGEKSEKGLLVKKS